MGRVTKWNDPKIAALNPGVKLPDIDLIVVHRSDGSGTTYVFTDYSNKFSREWKDKVGYATSVNWPVGLGAKGNEGVTQQIKQTEGALGYVELIYAISNKLPYQLVVKTSITSAEQLKGQAIAISRFGSNADFAARFLLQREGLRPDVDVALLQVGNQSNRIAATETNNADAAMLTPPMTLQARKLGMPLLVDASKLNIPYSSLFFVSRRPYLTKNRAELVNFTKAMIEGVHLYKSNKEFAMKVLSKYMKIQDREVLEENFREYDFPIRPYPAKEYFELPIHEVGKKDPKVLKENPERFADMSLVKELDSSGFIDKLSQEYKVTKPLDR